METVNEGATVILKLNDIEDNNISEEKQKLIDNINQDANHKQKYYRKYLEEKNRAEIFEKRFLKLFDKTILIDNS